MNKAFQRWRTRIRHECDEQMEGKEDGNGRLERERTYGIKHWGKDDFLAGNVKTPEMGASGPPEAYILARGECQNPRNGCLRTPEAYILARRVLTIPYHIIVVCWNDAKRKGGQGVQRTVSVGKGQGEPDGKDSKGVGRREPDLVES
eukprot:5109347-Pleurochrysis_carterae.AAC.1